MEGLLSTGPTPSSLEDVQCRKCDYIAKGKVDYSQHVVQAHKMSSVFPCLECDFKARTQENLERHVKFIVHRPNSEINSVE